MRSLHMEREARHGELKSAQQSDDVGDLCISDVFIEVGWSIDKWLWFVEAHQQV